ncbi:MAG: ribonuclease HI [Solirubrobacterales bacterium]|nr:ribonuclease HI [Solirubrobacterales bacterium]
MIEQGRGVPNLDDDALSIFTDGSSLGSPRAGGCAFVLVWCDENGDQQTDPVPGGAFAGASNNEMELNACVAALRDIQNKHTGKDLSKFSKVEIYTDSSYVAEHLGHAQNYWPRNGWTNRNGRPIDNVELWKQLTKEIERIWRADRRRVFIKWHKGHNKFNPHNKTADVLAKREAKTDAPKRHLQPVNTARKLSPKSTEVGSVKMEGQVLTIRIIGHEYLKEQRAYKYRYEVMNSDSGYHQNVDFIYSDEQMSRHHWYSVRVNTTTDNPWVEELLDEVDPTATPEISAD